MKITLIHPSRGRAQKAIDNFYYWLDNASGNTEIEHILSLDKDDTEVEKYKSLFIHSRITCVNNNSNVVEATNIAAQYATGDILIYLSDDFKCPKNWDELLVKAFQNIENPMLLKVDDCLQSFHICVLTIPIMNKELYLKLGYFWHPGYKSMFVDEDLYWTCFKNSWLVEAPGLKFPHEHVCNGKAENDDTYKRSAANWDQGKALFAKRKLENFPL